MQPVISLDQWDHDVESDFCSLFLADLKVMHELFECWRDDCGVIGVLKIGKTVRANTDARNAFCNLIHPSVRCTAEELRGLANATVMPKPVRDVPDKPDAALTPVIEISRERERERDALAG